MFIRTALASFLLLSPCVSLADCKPLVKSKHYVDLEWRAPDRFEDGSTLIAERDLTGYEIWLVEPRPGAIKKKKKLAVAEKDDLTCRVYAPDPGDQHVAMISIGVEHKSRPSPAALKNF